MTSQPQAGRPSSQRSGPVPAVLTYEFRVEGHLDDHWSAWLGDLTITRHHDGTSTLTGMVADQAQLHGVLAGLRDIGATLLSLNALEASPLPRGRTAELSHRTRRTPIGATGSARFLLSGCSQGAASAEALCTHPPPVMAKSRLLNSSWVRKWRPLITWL